jgi:hypothetical protein
MISKEETRIRKRIKKLILFFKGVSGVSSFKIRPILWFKFIRIAFF